MTGQLGSSLHLPGCPWLAADLHSADKSTSTLLLVVTGEWLSGHHPAPVTWKKYTVVVRVIVHYRLLQQLHNNAIHMHKDSLVCLHCHPVCSGRAEGDDTCHPQGRVGCDQTAGMQHTHRCKCHTQREGHSSGGNTCVALVTGGNIFHTCHQQDLVRHRAER